jgi:hypothetical protein
MAQAGPARRPPAARSWRPGSLVPGARSPAIRWRDPAPAAVSWPLPRYVDDKAHHMPQKPAAPPELLVNAGEPDRRLTLPTAGPPTITRTAKRKTINAHRPWNIARNTVGKLSRSAGNHRAPAFSFPDPWRDACRGRGRRQVPAPGERVPADEPQARRLPVLLRRCCAPGRASRETRPPPQVNRTKRFLSAPQDRSVRRQMCLRTGGQAANIGGWHAIPYGIP